MKNSTGRKLKKDVTKERAGVPEQEVGAGETAGKKEDSDLMQRIEAAEKNAADNYDKYLRTVAELENYKRRAAKERLDSIKYANETIIRDMLPLVDGMDRALEHACNSDDFDAFRKGLKLLQEQLLCCLGKHGVEQVEALGKDFDPHVHEAMMQVEGDEHEDNKVASEFEKGYLLHGRLLKPAKVSVCKCPNKKNKNGDAEERSQE
jgi:molecular chaperone GrpE